MKWLIVTLLVVVTVAISTGPTEANTVRKKDFKTELSSPGVNVSHAISIDKSTELLASDLSRSPEIYVIHDFSEFKFTPVLVKSPAIKVVAIDSYSWTSDCKCTKVSPNFAQYVAVSYCKNLAKPPGCK